MNPSPICIQVNRQVRVRVAWSVSRQVDILNHAEIGYKHVLSVNVNDKSCTDGAPNPAYAAT